MAQAPLVHRYSEYSPPEILTAPRTEATPTEHAPPKAGARSFTPSANAILNVGRVFSIAMVT